MPYNPNVSHRTYNLKCKWWSRINNSFNYEAEPNGVFYAKEFSGKEQSRDYFMGNNMVIMERDVVTLKSPDNLYDIKIDDAIEFDDEKWFVVATQRQKVRTQQCEFTKISKANYYWLISLRK